MTRQENIALIRAKVVEAVPEVMELKFGCKVSAPRGDASFISWQQEEPYHAVLLMHESSCPFIFNASEKEIGIVGRPIRLADVLVAIEEHGHFIRVTHAEDAEATWNLRADSLDDQNDECLQFLASLLTLS